MSDNIEKAIFAGGCFWCMVEPFDERPGINSVISGYTGGRTENPTYEEVCSNSTGHVEAVEITFDPSIVDYKDLVELFWQQIDPTDSGGQFHDRGESYQTAIYYQNEDQKKLAEASKLALEQSGKFNKAIVVPILPAEVFYKAEEHHQYYYKTNQLHYRAYKKGSGRAQFIEDNWTKQYDKVELKQRLTEEQYIVTQENGTERPFQNEYWNNEQEGIYTDIVSGEVLFSSKEQFDANCGWPSFTKPLVPQHITEHLDATAGMIRTEIRSKNANSHLGHVFEDGPVDQGGLRYCMNSAAMKFIKKEDLEAEGYGQYLYLFN